MEKENQNLWLIAVLLLSQNKKLMEDIRPVLTFLEEHEQSLSLLEKLFTAKAAEEAEASRAKPEEEPKAAEHDRKEGEKEGQKEEQKQEKTQSPFSGIANEEILKSIGAYFAANGN